MKRIASKVSTPSSRVLAASQLGVQLVIRQRYAGRYGIGASVSFAPQWSVSWLPAMTGDPVTDVVERDALHGIRELYGRVFD